MDIFADPADGDEMSPFVQLLCDRGQAPELAGAYQPPAPHRPRPVLETEEWLFESATEFIEALEKYYAAHSAPTLRRFATASAE